MRRLAQQLMLLPLLVGLAGATTQPAGKSLRVYHIGNSVTDTIGYKALQALAAKRGDQYIYGRHIMPGTPLVGLWDNQDKGFCEAQFGRSRAALTGHEWDVLTLQPFDRLLEGDRESDFETCSRFIDVALAKSPGLQVYIYQRWPKRAIVGKPKYDGTDKCEPIDYPARWGQTYSGGWDNTIETHDYFARLVAKLNASYEGKLSHPVRVVPVGDVMAKFDEAIRQGRVAGVASINDLYVDNVHLNDVGHYLVGLTFYATMFDADVTGLEARGYGKVDAATARVVAECVMAVCHTPEQ